MKNWMTQQNSKIGFTTVFGKSRILAALSMALTLAASLQSQGQAEYKAEDYDENGALTISLPRTLEPFNLDQSGLKISANAGGTIVTSNVPITEVEMCGKNGRTSSNWELKENLVLVSNPSGKAVFSLRSSDGSINCSWMKVPNVKTVSSGNSYSYLTVSKIKIAFGSYNISEDFRPAAGGLASWYQLVSQRLNEFEGKIKKSDRRHLSRLKTALADAVSGLKDPTDKEGKRFRTITDDRVREQARVVMVLATVLNELLNDYDDVPELQGSVTVLRNLSAQIRIAYGWDTGLSGNGSKAYAALCEVIDIELKDLYYTAGSFGGIDPSVFHNLMKANSALKRATAVATGGDARSNRQVKDFADVWNAQPWQQMLRRLANAPQDFQGLVQPKLKLLIMAVDSMDNFSGEKMNLDVESKLVTAERAESSAQAAATPASASAQSARKQPIKKP
jgi:hypothetical protein